MTDLTIIRHAPDHDRQLARQSTIRLIVPRATLAKRRWRGVAEDGREFGFDLDEAFPHGSHFFADDTRQYVVEQAPEEVLEIALTDPAQAARLAWNLGNLHFGLQVTPEAIRVASDPAVLQFLARENFPFTKVNCLFLPLSAVAHHHHHDHG